MSCLRCGTDQTNLNYCVYCRDVVALQKLVQDFLAADAATRGFIEETDTDKRTWIKASREARVNWFRGELEEFGKTGKVPYRALDFVLEKSK